ncbi:hypothetical protein T484DRAFT_1754842 [Baffinella frigidus]|nr:hypothetical protein T484DRAFT_1754842 [Cryptophyta sp. CCMP2293]
MASNSPAQQGPPPQRGAQAAAPAAAAAAAASAGSARAAGATAEPARVSTDAASKQLRQLRAACSAWFGSVNGGLHDAYDFDKATADQEGILALFDTLSTELRKTGRPSPPS